MHVWRFFAIVVTTIPLVMHHVCVKFVADAGEEVATSSNCVKNFRPKTAADFQRGKLNECYWPGDETTEGGYYNPRIFYKAGKWKSLFRAAIRYVIFKTDRTVGNETGLAAKPIAILVCQNKDSLSILSVCKPVDMNYHSVLAYY